MRFKTMKSHGRAEEKGAACCSLCAQDIYVGERAWRRGGVTVCEDCFLIFARGELGIFEFIPGEETRE